MFSSYWSDKVFSFNVTVTLAFDLEAPRSIGSSTIHNQPPYQVRRSLGYEFCSYWSDKVCLRTDGPTDICNSIYSHFFEGVGIIMESCRSPVNNGSKWYWIIYYYKSYIFVNFFILESKWVTLVKQEPSHSGGIPQLFGWFMNGNSLVGQGCIKTKSNSSDMSIRSWVLFCQVWMKSIKNNKKLWQLKQNWKI